MAGPADYLRLTGPLGGATFLGVDEMTSGLDRQQRLAGGILDNVGKGVKLREQIEGAEEARSIRKEREVIAQAEMEAAQQLQQTVAQQAEAQAQPVPSTVPAAVAPRAQPTALPAQAPAAVQPAPMPAAPQQATPAAPMAPAAQQAAPQLAAPQTPAPVAAPAVPTQPAPQVDPLAAPILPNGQVNRLSPQIFDARVQLIEKLAQEGKIRPATAQAYIGQIGAARSAQMKVVMETREKIAEIEGKELDAKEKRLKIAATVREGQDNLAHQVYQVFKSNGPEAAAEVARELGVQADFTKPADLKKLEVMAKRSPEYKAMKEEERKAGEAFKWKVDEETGIASGVDPASGTPIFRGSDGRVYTSAEAAARKQDAGVRKAAAGRTTVNVDNKQETEFAKGVGKADAEQVTTLRNQRDASRQAYGQYKRIGDIIENNPGIISGPGGGFKAFAARVAGDGADPNVVARDFVQQAQSSLELAQAQANRGQGSLTEAERTIMRKASTAGGIEQMNAQEMKIFVRGMQKVEARRQAEINEGLDEIQQRNPNVKLGTFRKAPMEGGAPSAAPDVGSLRSKWGAQ